MRNKINSQVTEDYIYTPFNIYFYEFYSKVYKYSIIDDMYKMKNDKNVPFDKLVRDIDEFKRLYELFRPEKITHDHFYHGTVKIMDAIYDFFASAFKIEYDERFSKYGYSWLDGLLKKDMLVNPQTIEWERIIGDLNTIKSCINGAIFELAIENHSYFEKYHTYEYSVIIINYITEKFNIDNETFIKDNIKPGSIKIGNEIHEFRRSYELFRLLDNNYTRKK